LQDERKILVVAIETRYRELEEKIDKIHELFDKE
jgi:hypothetical protein